LRTVSPGISWGTVDATDRTNRANPVNPANLTNPGWRPTLDVALVREASRAKLLGARYRREVRVGRYVLHERLGRGGMGVVVRAHDPQLGRDLAVKLIDPGLAGEHDARARFLREARALARIDHPNVVPIHDVGMVEDQLWIAMEYIPGSTLRRWIEVRARPTRVILDVLLAAGHGLAAAHQAGLTHRDFKPDNVMVAPVGADAPTQVRVTDFGLAALAQEDTVPGAELERSPTQTGTATHSTGMVGTLGYVAPERLRGETIGPASDQFAFCVTAWECLGGVRPFAGSPAAVCAATLEASRSGLPGARAIAWPLRRILLRGLAADPRDRFASMDELLAALGRNPSRAPRTAALALGGLAAAWWLASGPAPCADAERALDGVWSSARSAEIGRAFAATGAPQSDATWARASERIDRHAARWLKAHGDACKAHAGGERSSDLFDATVACLERRRAELTSVLDVLARPDPEVVRRTLGQLVVLDPIEPCMDADLLLGGPEPPPPSAAAAVSLARVRLSDAEALERAGRYAETLAIVAELETSEALKAYGPIEAEIALRRGTALLHAERYDESRAALESAFFSAERVGARDVALEAATELVYCVGYRQARHEEGLTWARHARARADRATAQERAAIANAEGAVSRAKGDAEEALARYEEAASLRAEAGEAEIDVAWAASRNNIGLALADLHRYEDAIAALRESLATRRDLLGSDHPDVADSLSNLAMVLTDAGSDEEAERLLVEAIALRERAFGPEHVSVGRALINLSIVDQHLQRPALAAEHLLRALEILEQALGADHLHVATTRHNLSFIFGDLDRWAEALMHADAALAIRRVRLGDEAVLTLQTRAVRASTLFELGRTDEAVAEQREILRLHALAGRADSPIVAAAHGDCGRMLARLQRHGEAIAELEIALAIQTRTRGADHPKTIATAEALREARVGAAATSSSPPSTRG
jgi:tetratricopeptide (TPR) repeat protein